MELEFLPALQQNQNAVTRPLQPGRDPSTFNSSPRASCSEPLLGAPHACLGYDDDSISMDDRQMKFDDDWNSM